jgi:AmmeMemoRadiSam system protein B
MPLIFAAITPHPPLLIPKISGRDFKKVDKTQQAMEKLAELLEKANPETIVILSPHNLVYPDHFNVNSMAKLRGDFDAFRHPEITFTFRNDLELANKIIAEADKEGIPVVPYDNEKEFFELDHGSLVPLNYLTSEIGSSIKVLPIAYSMRDRKDHFVFGQLMRNIFQKSKKRIAFVASGDLSHRLLEQNQAAEVGKYFDETIKNSIEHQDFSDILNIDPKIRELAGECGYNSIVTLLGVIDTLNTKPKILSYESPFGVGYLVADLGIK